MSGPSTSRDVGGRVRFTGLHASLPLGELVGDTPGQLAAMREWFDLADPVASFAVGVTAVGGPVMSGRLQDARDAVAERLDGIAGHEATYEEAGMPGLAGARGERGFNRARERGVLRFACCTREWSPDVAVRLAEEAGGALRGAGCAEQVVVSASLSLADAVGTVRR
ncbi:hypothetical protein I5Q34_18025 [Streptomyces sp. AV19]|uniref:hypothetical protein n=1 Tax=Streptomyces sp. AV19 TaxID=2793068 RepID=UPI0018FE8532|nr:hypothetical protein [Streptomyces sp. AV19]MBH1936145.1 hypothetical protein [Streptomyces sp. AV19]MDG4534059.1 hypothetical protein [Streptomyces sp. AV19]